MISELRKVLKRLHYPLDAGLRALVRSLPAERSPSGRNDLAVRGLCRRLDRAPLVIEAIAGLGAHISSTQASG